MMYTLALLGIYLLSVGVLVVTAHRRPERLQRLYPLLWVGIYSFMPAIALGREILLFTDRSTFVVTVPVWLNSGFAALIVFSILPVRTGILSGILDRTAQAARRSLDDLPEQMVEIDVDVSRGVISLDNGNRRKQQLQRETDRTTAVDGVGRFLYLLFKIHLLRLGLQILGAVAIGVWSEIRVGWYTLNTCVTMVILDGASILGPFLILMSAMVLL